MASSRERGGEREPKPEALGFAEYWNKRYNIDKTIKSEEVAGDPKSDLPSYDWFRSYTSIKPFLQKHMPPAVAEQPRILHLGCGNSVCSERSLFENRTDGCAREAFARP